MRAARAILSYLMQLQPKTDFESKRTENLKEANFSRFQLILEQQAYHIGWIFQDSGEISKINTLSN